MAVKNFALGIILGATDNASPTIGKVGARLDKIGKRTAAIGRSLTTSLTLPLVGVGVAATAAFSKFEQGMSNVSTLLDTNEEDMDKMGKQVLAIGRRAPVAISNLTEALFDVRSAGVGAGDAMNVLEQSARLGVAGLGSTQQAVDLVTSSMNAFQLEGKEAERVYDLIFKTTKFGKTTIEGLAQGFGSVAGTIANSGTELDEYLASVSALTTTGLPAAQAHTQLRAVIAGLTRETSFSRKVFQKLGAEDFKDLIARSGGLVGALERIKGELKGDDAQMLKLLGSTEALGAVIGLTGAQNATYAATLEDMRKGANAVDVAFDKQNKTAQAGIQRTKNALLSMGVSIGQILAPMLEKLATKIQSVVNWFMSLDSNTKTFIVDIAKIVAVAGPAILIMGKLSLAIRAIGLAFSATPVGAALIALVTATAAAAAAVNLLKAPDESSSAKSKILGDRGSFAPEVVEEKRLAQERQIKIQKDRNEETLAEIGARQDREKEAAAAEAGNAAENRGRARIFVEFKNAPEGTRVDSEDTGLVDLLVGNQFGGASE